LQFLDGRFAELALEGEHAASGIIPARAFDLLRDDCGSISATTRVSDRSSDDYLLRLLRQRIDTVLDERGSI
jgi:hypothetical protein